MPSNEGTMGPRKAEGDRWKIDDGNRCDDEALSKGDTSGAADVRWNVAGMLARRRDSWRGRRGMLRGHRTETLQVEVKYVLH